MSDWSLEIVEGSGVGTTFEVGSDGVELGRDPSLSQPLEDEHASRRHARIEPAADGVYVEDLGSYNGTYVNEQPISRRVLLSPGDSLRVGLTVLALADRGRTSAVPAPTKAPAVTKLDAEVLSPATESELVSELAEGQTPPRVRTEEVEPGYIRASAVRAALGRSESGDADVEQSNADALARLIDTRVKRQTNIAAFALLAGAALAVVIVLGI